jgi:RNA polymerase sigma factor (TIGR02999 family)
MSTDNQSIAANADTVTLLRSCAAGDVRAYDRLFASIYEDLRRRAHRLRSAPDDTLSTTALVHETYLKLAGSEVAPNDRLHFFAIAARAMRQILVNAARDAAAQKRGGGLAAATLDDAIADFGKDPVDMLMLDQVIDRLGEADARLRQVVELHFFAGLNFAEIGDLLDISERTAMRDWRAARAVLQSAMDEIAADGR